MLHAEKMLPSDKPMPEADLEAFAALIDQADLSSLRTWACNASFRRVSTTLRQVLTKFSEFFMCWVFHKENSAPGSPSNDDRQLGRPTASQLFLFHLPGPTGSGSGLETGLLIQTSLGRAGGLGALRTKRSG